MVDVLIQTQTKPEMKPTKGRVRNCEEMVLVDFVAGCKEGSVLAFARGYLSYIKLFLTFQVKKSIQMFEFLCTKKKKAMK